MEKSTQPTNKNEKKKKSKENNKKDTDRRAPKKGEKVQAKEDSQPPQQKPPGEKAKIAKLPRQYHTALEMIQASTIGYAESDSWASLVAAEGAGVLVPVASFTRSAGGHHPVSAWSRKVGFHIGLTYVISMYARVCKAMAQDLVHVVAGDFHGAMRTEGYMGLCRPKDGEELPRTEGTVFVQPIHPNTHAGDLSTGLFNVDSVLHTIAKEHGQETPKPPPTATQLSRCHVVGIVDVYMKADDPWSNTALGPQEVADVISETKSGQDGLGWGFMVYHPMREAIGADVFTSVDAETNTRLSSHEGRWFSEWKPMLDAAGHETQDTQRWVTYRADSVARAYPPHIVDQTWLEQRCVATSKGYLDINCVATTGPFNVMVFALSKVQPQYSVPAGIPQVRFGVLLNPDWKEKVRTVIRLLAGADPEWGVYGPPQLTLSRLPEACDLIYVRGQALYDEELVLCFEQATRGRIKGGLNIRSALRTIEGAASSDPILSAVEPMMRGLTTMTVSNSALVALSRQADRGLIQGAYKARENAKTTEEQIRLLASTTPLAPEPADQPKYIIGAGALLAVGLRTKGASWKTACFTGVMGALLWSKRKWISSWLQTKYERPPGTAQFDAMAFAKRVQDAWINTTEAASSMVAKVSTVNSVDKAKQTVQEAWVKTASAASSLATSAVSQVQCASRAKSILGWFTSSEWGYKILGGALIGMTVLGTAPIIEEALCSITPLGKVVMGVAEVVLATGSAYVAAHDLPPSQHPTGPALLRAIGWGCAAQLPALAFHCYTALSCKTLGEDGALDDYWRRVRLHMAFNAVALGTTAYFGKLGEMAAVTGKRFMGAMLAAVPTQGAASFVPRAFEAWMHETGVEHVAPDHFLEEVPAIHHLPAGQRMRGVRPTAHVPEHLTHYAQKLKIEAINVRRLWTGELRTKVTLRGNQAVEWYKALGATPDSCTCGLLGICDDCLDAPDNQFSYTLCQTNGALVQPRPCRLGVLSAIFTRTLADPTKGEMKTPKREERYLAEKYRALSEILPLLEEVFTGDFSLQDEEWTIERCAKAAGGQKEALMLQTAYDMATSDVKRDKTLAMKWNETIALKDLGGHFGMIPRIIVALSNAFQAEQQPNVRTLTDFLKHRCASDADPIDIVRKDGTVCKVKFVISNDAHIDSYADLLLNPACNVSIVSCDDGASVGVDTGACEGLPFFEGKVNLDDFSKFDQSQYLFWFLVITGLMENLGLDESVESIMETVTKSFRAKAGTGKDKIFITGECHPHEPTGGAGTSIFGSMVHISMRIYAIYHKISFEEASRALGLTLKTELVDPIDTVFLRMGIFKNAEGSWILANLPSCFLKWGKIFKNPATIARSVKPSEATAMVALAIVKSFPCVTPSYPILGAYLRRLTELVEATSPPQGVLQKMERVINDSYINENARYKVKSRKVPTRQSVLELMERRYNITEQEVNEVESLISSIKALPCFITHPCFVKMRLADY